jgi:hypothetical protein
LRTGSVTQFNWTGVIAAGKKCHWSKVPCHTNLEATFSDFLDSAPDVLRYTKNERLDFSVTYYENGRPRQYFPDFVAEVAATDGSVLWLVETKGEVHPNTELKREAAELWCERMSRAGQGIWRHLFVPQVAFEGAIKVGVMNFGALVSELSARERKKAGAGAVG